MILSGMPHRLGISVLSLSLLIVGCQHHEISSSAGAQDADHLVSQCVIDRTSSTVFLSDPTAVQSGVDGRILTIASVHYDRDSPTDELTLDINGNLGLRGDVYTLLDTRSAVDRSHVARYDAALALAHRMPVISYRSASGDHETVANRLLGRPPRRGARSVQIVGRSSHRRRRRDRRSSAARREGRSPPASSRRVDARAGRAQGASTLVS